MLAKFVAAPLLNSDISSVDSMTLEQISSRFPEVIPISVLVQIDNELVKIK